MTNKVRASVVKVDNAGTGYLMRGVGTSGEAVILWKGVASEHGAKAEVLHGVDNGAIRHIGNTDVALNLPSYVGNIQPYIEDTEQMTLPVNSSLLIN